MWPESVGTRPEARRLARGKYVQPVEYRLQHLLLQHPGNSRNPDREGLSGGQPDERRGDGAHTRLERMYRHEEGVDRRADELPLDACGRKAGACGAAAC